MNAGMDRAMAQQKSPHILNTSSNLLGFCLIVLTSLKVADKSEASFIDEATVLASVLLMTSCVLSFLSMRAVNEKRAMRLERTADVVFLGGLSLVFVAILLIAVNFMG